MCFLNFLEEQVVISVVVSYPPSNLHQLKLGYLIHTHQNHASNTIGTFNVLKSCEDGSTPLLL